MKPKNKENYQPNRYTDTVNNSSKVFKITPFNFAKVEQKNQWKRNIMMPSQQQRKIQQKLQQMLMRQLMGKQTVRNSESQMKTITRKSICTQMEGSALFKKYFKEGILTTETAAKQKIDKLIQICQLLRKMKGNGKGQGQGEQNWKQFAQMQQDQILEYVKISILSLQQSQQNDS